MIIKLYNEVRISSVDKITTFKMIIRFRSPTLLKGVLLYHQDNIPVHSSNGTIVCTEKIQFFFCSRQCNGHT